MEPVFRVRGYASASRAKTIGVSPGALLVATVHDSEGSKDTEVLAWRARMRRGEVMKIEIDDIAKRTTEIIWP